MPSTTIRTALATTPLLDNQGAAIARCWWGYVHHHV
jgi:hypothetical protein